jgi:peptide/nickel transport system substrate-binding protein
MITTDATPTVTPPITEETTAPKKHWLIWGIIAVAVLAAITLSVWSVFFSKPEAAAKKDIPNLTYGVISGPLNSYFPNASVGVDEYTFNEQIFEGLVTYRDRKIVPNLATSWTNPDTSTWVFNLKTGVKFHSGRTMTAADVKYSIEQVNGKPYGDLFASTIKSVEVTGANQVKIITDGPDPVLLNKLIFLFVVDSKSTAPGTADAGTGPYTLKPGSQNTENSADLIAFDQYQGGHVYTRELHFRVFGDDAAMTDALKQGKVNLATFSDIAVSDSLKSKYYTFYIDDPTVFSLIFNVRNHVGPLQKLKVRQAVYQAIDVNAFIKAIGAKGTPANQIVVKDIPGYNPDIVRPAFDQTAAKKLLANAGYPNGLTLTFSYAENISLLQSVADEVKRQLAQVGITVKLEKLSGDHRSDPYQGKSEMYFTGYSSDLLDLSDAIATEFQGPNYDNPAVDTLMLDANKTFDPAKRLSVLKDASKTLMDDVAYAPIYSGVAPYLLDKSNYVMPVDIPATAYPGVYFWRVYQQ